MPDLFWEVQFSEFAKERYSRIVVGSGGIFLSFIAAEIYAFLAVLNSSYPLFHAPLFRVPMDPFIAGAIVFALVGILIVLGAGRVSKIMDLIVQAIAVFVIVFHTFRRWAYDIVHEYCFSFTRREGFSADGVVFTLPAKQSPFPLVEIFKPVVIYSADFPACERNYLHSYLTVQKIKNQAGVLK